MKRTAFIQPITILLLAPLLLGACTDAQMASRNLSKASDQFEVLRRVVFYNGITDAYPLEIIGLCSIRSDDRERQIEVTCKTSGDQYKKHYMGLSDNMTYIVEQLDPRPVNVDHYRVVFKPQAIIPDMDLRWDGDAVPAPQINRNPIDVAPPGRAVESPSVDS